MTDEEIIRELKNVEERYRNKPVPTFEVNISSMAVSCRQHIEQQEKENAELKKEISVLLSCSDCPENKGGYICEKEYNNKCLAQKIEHIKELNEENAKKIEAIGFLSHQLAEKINQVQILEEKLEKLNNFDKTQSYKLLQKVQILKDFVRSVSNEECKYIEAEIKELLEL